MSRPIRAKMEDHVRVVLNFTNTPVEKCLYKKSEKFWYLIKKKVLKTVEDLQNDIIAKFFNNGSCYEYSDLELFVDECFIPTWEDVNIIRDNDKIMVCMKSSGRHRGSKRKDSEVLNTELLSPKKKKIKKNKKVEEGVNEDQICSDATENTNVCDSKVNKKGKKAKRERKCQEPCDTKDESQNVNSQTAPVVPQDSHLNVDVTENRKASEARVNVTHEARRIDDSLQDSVSLIEIEKCSKVQTIEDNSNRKRNRRRKRKRPSKTKDETSVSPYVSQFEENCRVEQSHSKFTPDPEYAFSASTDSSTRLRANQNHVTFDSEPDNEENQVKKSNDFGEQLNTGKSDVLLSSTCSKTDSNSNRASSAILTGMSQNDSIVSVPNKSDVPNIVQESHTTPGSMHSLNSSKAQNHMNGDAQFQLICDAQVFDRRKQKRKGNFPLSQAVEISQRDVYTNKSFVFETTCGNETSLTGDFVSQSEGVFQFGNENVKQSQIPVKDYSKYPALFGAPRIGDLIAYKVLEMSDDYSPGISDYKEAKVITFDPVSKVLTLELATCKATGTGGRFHCEIEDEQEILTVEKEYIGLQVDLLLTSLLEPKLLS